MRARGWTVTTVGRTTPAEEAAAALATASHVLSTVPPQEGADPVLAAHGPTLAASGAWLGYLSSTGVYGDAGGAWVDEAAPLRGRRGGRIEADRAWCVLGARVLRLPGIYGPGRSMLERVAEGKAHRVDVAGQVFSRVHRDDIVSGVRAAMAGPPGAYNLADDEPAAQNAVVEEACRLLGAVAPPIRALDDAGLSPMARAFYAENRRVAAGRAHRLLGWRPAYPTYREGLRALMASASPATASAAPTPAATLQR
jgi:nucleoside-diphosphate-sugar epimerase